MPAGQERKTSPWTWIAGGCLTLLVLGVLVIGGGIFMVGRLVRNVETDMKDPSRRDTRAREVLGVDRLPEGYNAVVALSVPLLADIAVLSDAPPKNDAAGGPGDGTAGPPAEGSEGGGPRAERQDLGDRGLIYIRFRKFGQNMKEVEDYLSGKTNDPEALSRNHINLKVHEVLRRGVIEGDPALMYLVQRGDVNFQGSDSGVRLVTMVLPRCSSGNRIPIALWYAPDVATAKADDPASLAGTVGDEAEIRKFMGQFKLCP